jgi:hypothetical protein
MKRYSIPMLAGVPVEIDHPGRFFTLLGCITPVDVSLQAAALRTEVLESILPGIWCDFGEAPFSRIRVVSPVDQTVTFLVSMVRSGWKQPPPSQIINTMDISGAAASAALYGSWIDLSDDFASVVMSVQFYGTASAGGIVGIQCSPDQTTDLRVAVGQGWNGGAVGSIAGGGTAHLSSFRPVSRFVRSFLNNGATIQAAGSKVVLTVMRNVTA